VYQLTAWVGDLRYFIPLNDTSVYEIGRKVQYQCPRDWYTGIVSPFYPFLTTIFYPYSTDIATIPSGIVVRPIYPLITLCTIPEYQYTSYGATGTPANRLKALRSPLTRSFSLPIPSPSPRPLTP
jgi:hypothetical protein